MEWDKEALEIIENIPLPPMIAHYAPMDAIRRAKKKGLDRITPDIAKATEKGYAKALGKESMEVMGRMMRGEDPGLPDEFFEEEKDELYTIELCPVKFGASSLEKRENTRRLLTPLRNKLKELNTTGVMMDKAETSIMSHHAFRIGITGCPNACFSPYFCDFGVLGVYRPGVKDTGCVDCGKCVKYCSENAITIENKQPVIDYDKCVLCSGCVEECDKDVIFTEKLGYKVVVGGNGSRHAQIAKTVAEFTDLDGVLKILEKCINLMKKQSGDGKVITLSEMINKYGTDTLKP